eukprot:363777-Prymnesium_polylepis.1
MSSFSSAAAPPKSVPNSCARAGGGRPLAQSCSEDATSDDGRWRTSSQHGHLMCQCTRQPLPPPAD